jgi:hypothetical protein
LFAVPQGGVENEDPAWITGHNDAGPLSGLTMSWPHCRGLGSGSPSKPASVVLAGSPPKTGGGMGFKSFLEHIDPYGSS